MEYQRKGRELPDRRVSPFPRISLGSIRARRLLMLYHSYLKNALVYVPTVVKLHTGVYMDVDPVAVLPVVNTDGLRRALLEAIARKNAIVPNPPKDDWPPPVLLKYAGAKTRSAFARGHRSGASKRKTGSTR